jgi:sirohydrochlorin ferrochelatase
VLILLVAHGSPGPHHAVAVQAVAAAVRERGTPCVAGFLDHDSPDLVGAMDAVVETEPGTEVVAVPMLLNRAYHARVDVPAAVDALRTARPDLQVRLSATLGPDPLLVDALERRLVEAVLRRGGAPALHAVALVASGSSDPAAREGVAELAASWSRDRLAPVAHAFASGEGPDAAAAVAALRAGGAEHVALVPYLLAGGVLLDRAAELARTVDADVVLAEPLGAAPELVDVVLARATAPGPA